ncbi:MAG: T9SS type A sorting domain-containing protein, partial [Nitrososphaerales archaeon]
AFHKGDSNKIDFFKESWGQIIITDADGKTFKLYAVSGDVDLNNYELPPAPPSGMFDIRFSSGRIAEDFSTGNQTIEMNGLQYPVNIKVKNMNITLQDVTGTEINKDLISGDNISISNEFIKKLVLFSKENNTPNTYSLEQNYPNPFNPSTIISFSIPQNSQVNLSVFNVLGEKVAMLINEMKDAGSHQVEFNAANLTSGIYVYKLEAGSFSSVKKMMLLK